MLRHAKPGCGIRWALGTVAAEHCEAALGDGEVQPGQVALFFPPIKCVKVLFFMGSFCSLKSWTLDNCPEGVLCVRFLCLLPLNKGGSDKSQSPGKGI